MHLLLGVGAAVCLPVGVATGAMACAYTCRCLVFCIEDKFKF